MNGMIMAQFREKNDLYREFAVQIENLLNVLLQESKVFVHSISSRVKDSKSLQKKLEKNAGKYHDLTDITDIAGARIITYFADEVDAVAAVVEKEFAIDWENSIDKRQLIDPDRFGYTSLHYVVSFSSERLQLDEYRNFKGFKAEFQIRSILQHAWAEIEHDLGYKRKHAIPREVRRSFSRVAGLLEIADQEFSNIREAISSYENDVVQQIGGEPEKVNIDAVSLAAYINLSPVLQEINLGLSKLHGGVRIVNNPYIDDKVDSLHSMDIKTVAELDRLLQRNKKIVLAFAEVWLAGENRKRCEDILDTTGIFYFCYVLLGASQSEDAVCEYLQTNAIGNISDRKKLAGKIISVYRQAAAKVA